MLDLRAEPLIIEVPAFDSKYVIIDGDRHDHYVNFPMSTRLGDFSESSRILFMPSAPAAIAVSPSQS